MMRNYIGIDLGGTNIAAAILTEAGQILNKSSIKTNAPRSAESICDDIVSLCHTLLSESNLSLHDISGLGIGSPGLVLNGSIIYASNLAFEDVPLAKLLSERMDNMPVHLENDANAAAYGEFVCGAGKGFSSLMMLTIGTGIGGGIIHDRKVLEGFNGAAGELGHIVIQANGRRCSCGKAGCLEAYCSATSLKNITQEVMKNAPNSELWQLADGNLENVSAKTAFDSMRLGDLEGKKIVDDFIYHLSLGVSNAINLFQPEVFCIGGGVSREGDAIILPLTQLVKKQTYLRKEEHRTKIVTAHLGNDAGLIGAALASSRSKSI